MKKIVLPSLLALAVSANLSAAEFEFAGNGSLKFGGDLELDADMRSDSDAKHTQKDKFEQSGRILLDIEGEKTFGNNYAKFKAQPLVHFDGEMGVDDAYVEFGAYDNWSFRAGRYEAIDLFPMGQDTIVDYVKSTDDIDDADNANLLGVYLYHANEGRGRADGAGQMMFSKILGNFYTELSTKIGDAEDMYFSYGNAAIDDDGYTGEYTAVIRPAVQYRGDGWRATAGVEYFSSDQTIKVEGHDLDIDDRFGYGATFAYDLPYGVINASYAHLTSDEMDATSYGVNTIINQWGLGYVYGENEYDGKLKHLDDSDVNSVYGSYIVQNLLGVDNMEIHLGMFYSWGDLEGVEDDSEVAGRVRFKYHF